MKLRIQFKILIIKIFILVPFEVICQILLPNQNNFTSFNNANHTIKTDTIFIANAPSKITRKIRRDKDNNLLIASFSDIIQYDGTSFSKIPKPIKIEGYDAFDALKDSKGNIWVGSTHYGVFCYDGESIKHFTKDDGLASNRIIDIYEDSKSNIWFATLEGASCYNGKEFRNFTTQDGLPNNDVNTIMEDNEGNIWLGTAGDACIYNGKTFTKLSSKTGRTFGNVRQIIKDKSGNIWFGGDSGLWQSDGITFTNYSVNFVGGIYADTKGNIWTTGLGSFGWALSMYKKAVLSTNIVVATEIKANENMLFGISEDKAGNIWVGMLQGVFKYDGNTISYFMNR